jgi:putative ABC transport system permease protein
VNIFGLALAIACGLVIVLFIHDELKYDRYHSKAERIYIVTRDFRSEGVVNLHLVQVAPPIGPLLKNDFREIEEEQGRTLRYNFLVSIPDKIKREFLPEQRYYFAEPQVLDVFDITLKEGNPKNALNNPFTLMLSRKNRREILLAQNERQEKCWSILTIIKHTKISGCIRGLSR